MKDDSLALGLRALDALAGSGPLAPGRLASMEGCQLQRAVMVLAELEREGWVRRLPDWPMFAMTERGTSLFEKVGGAIH